MRILILADAHGDDFSVQSAIQAQPEASHIIFLGDGCELTDRLASENPGRFHAVSGNNDWYSPLPEQLLLSIGGKTIFACHGHRYRVKYGTDELISAARARRADLALYGHTHEPCSEYIDGLTLLNPGSVSARGSHTYAIADITPAGLVTNTITLDR